MSVKTTTISVTVGIVLIGAISAATWYGLHHKSTANTKFPADAVARVGNHIITKADFAKYVANGEDRTQALDCVMRDTLYADMATAYKVQLTNAMTTDAMAGLGVDPKAVTAFQTVCIRADVRKMAVAAAITGHITGKVVIAHFDMNIAADNGAKTTVNPAAVAGDRIYAQALITKLYDAVKAGTMTMDQAIAAQAADAKIGVKALPTSIQSGGFDTGAANLTPLSGLVSTQQSLEDALNSVSAGAVTPVITLQTISGEGATQKATDIMFAFGQLGARVGAQGISFNAAVTKQKQLGYEVAPS